MPRSKAVSLIVTLTVLSTLTGTLCAAAAEPPGREDWLRWQNNLYLGPVPVPDEGIVWQVDTARLSLGSGQLWLLEPTGSGAYTGVVFEGDGRFEMTVPDAIELRQLQRFAQDRELEEVDTTFERLVLRSSDQSVVELLGELAGESIDKDLSENRVARNRHQRWLLDQSHDASARVIAGLRNMGDRYFRADFETPNLGWLTFQYDASLSEEIDLLRFSVDGRFGVLESWLSLDRAEERAADGRPSGAESTRVALEHVDAEVDLTRVAKRAVGGARGLGRAYPMEGAFSTTVRFRSRRNGTAALELVLHPMAKLESVTHAGTELEFLRFPTGHLAANMSQRFSNPTFVVLLDKPLGVGEAIELQSSYQLELPNYAPGLIWYPTVRGMHDQPHTGRIALTLRRRYDAIAMGREVEDAEVGKRHRTVWEIDRPTRMLGFVYGNYPHQRRYQENGLPPVTLFGTRGGWMSADRVEEASEHVLGSLHYLQQLYDLPIDAPELFVGLIGSRHGQAFSGMIQIDDLISATPGWPGFAYYGRTQLFVAHEVAHQYWGHGVGWASYRDQWLSEAMAEYAAMMYVEAEVEHGEEVFESVLAGYTFELLGSIEGAFGAFARPGVALLNKQGRKRIGPIGHGYRAATAEAPTAFSSMSYRKGALVVHMIRQYLRARTGGDDAFVGLLRELLRSGSEGELSTALLQQHLERLTPSDGQGTDWQGFFDRFVYGTEIPTWHWSSESFATRDGGWRVELTVEQDGVSSSFEADVPVLVELSSGEVRWQLIHVAGDGAHSFELDAEPKRVVFNPRWSVLARMRPRQEQRISSDAEPTG